ncbi:MAG: 30S ribosomal protein S20 [Bacillota bacterium]
MPNIKSAIKRVEITLIRTQRNTARKSAMKTAIKRVEEAVTSGEKEKAQRTLVFATKLIDQAAARGLIHKNTAARRKSRLSRMMKTIG